MQSELKKMYFFAMNYKDKMKEDPMNEIEGKKKSIKNLTGLLNYENSLQKLDSRQSPNKIASVPHKKSIKQKNQRSVSCKVYPSPNQGNNQLLFPQVSKRVTLHRQNYLKMQKQKEENEKYEKYINDYLGKMSETKLVQNYENNHQKLIEEACRQIKKNIMKENSQKSIEREKSKQKIKKIDKKQYFLMENKSKKKLSNTIFDDNQRKKSQSVAQKNVYRLDLDRIEKTKELRQRERRRTQRNFVRKLSKIGLPSFHNLY